MTALTAAAADTATVIAVAPWVVTAVMVVIAAMGVAAGLYGLREAKEWRERSDHHRDLYRVEVAGRKDAEQRAASNAYEAQVAVRWVQLRDEREAAKQALERDVSLRSLVEDDGWDLITTDTGVVYVPPDRVTTTATVVALVTDDSVDVGVLTAAPVVTVEDDTDDDEDVPGVAVPPPVPAVPSWRDRGKTTPTPPATAHGRDTPAQAPLRVLTGPILTDGQAAEAKRDHAAGVTWGELAERFGVAPSTVARAARRA